MTLIAGFKCDEGFVICSDSQETVSGDDGFQSRVTRQKLEAKSCGKFSLAMAGSGNGEVIDACIEWIQQEVSSTQLITLGALREFIQQQIRAFNKAHSKEYTLRERRIQLLIGATTHVAPYEAALWMTSASLLREVPDHALIGYNDERYEYAVQNMYRNKQSIAQGIFLGIYVILLAEKTCDTVMRPVSVAVVKGSGINLEDQKKINELTIRVQLFASQFDQMFLACPDTGLQNEAFSDRIKEFVATVVQLRTEYVTEWVGQAVDTGLDRVLEQWNLVPAGTTILLDAQSTEHLRLQELISNSLRENEDGKQSKERLLANLQVLLTNREKRYRKFGNPGGLPIEELTESERSDEVRAYTELDAAARMGAFKVPKEVVNLIHRALSYVREDHLFGEQIELQLQAIAIKQAMNYIERTLPVNDPQSDFQPASKHDAEQPRGSSA